MRKTRFAALAAFILLATQAGADNHIREYVIPNVPGTDRTTYRNTFIVLTNHQDQSANIGITAHEPISKSFEQDTDGCEVDESEEILRIVLPSNENPTLPLQP